MKWLDDASPKVLIMPMKKRLNLILIFLIISFIAYCAHLDFHIIDPSGIGDDASQNLRTGLNLLKHGVYSEKGVTNDVIAGFRREPIPNFILAFQLKYASLFNADLLNYSGKDEFPSELLLAAKQVNIVYAMGLMISLWLLTLMLVAPAWMANTISFPLIALVNEQFIAGEMNTLDTELPAAFFMVLLALISLVMVKNLSLGWILISGISFGLLVMTKQSGAYVAVICIPIILTLLPSARTKFFMNLFLFSLGFAVVVSPWVIRNRIEFGRSVISRGGGDVLLIRSVFNQMSPLQFRNAFYSFSPKPIRDDLLGPIMGLESQDHSCGKILDVFNRKLLCDSQALDEGRYQDVRSFYIRGKRAEPLSMNLSNSLRKREALSRILANPLQHLIISFPLAWRGIWAVRPEGWGDVILNILSFLALLASPLLYFLEKRKSWLIVSIVPIGYFLFYALFSHFIPRYSQPLVPLAFICLMMVVVDMASKMLPPSVVRLRDY